MENQKNSASLLPPFNMAQYFKWCIKAVFFTLALGFLLNIHGSDNCTKYSFRVNNIAIKVNHAATKTVATQDRRFWLQR